MIDMDFVYAGYFMQEEENNRAEQVGEPPMCWYVERIDGKRFWYRSVRKALEAYMGRRFLKPPVYVEVPKSRRCWRR